ncbi:MAG: ribonucleoside-diphosphate reductase, adenosylcobalamin-dependent [Candidatus Parvarchaeum acidiphilum ARMAN-4]|uniref:Vitamin B12-dependent ribonucleotide reductase n=1 Tax=Candidatus Parvarchaeum acidiphilum ARMAN-4 TaxID=662760 RepID=D2EFV5_PARA4|nr:MAG: ribonucleoside-diphosphate reductase, adenosylcobalamin-dependent [Candidatus Parvarchaeum acidiphilum ARMAN-4]
MIDLPKETLEFFDNDELRSRIFYEKYSLSDLEGNRTEKTPIEMWKRISRELASVEKDDKKKDIENNFYRLLEDFKFVPGGRILFGAGANHKATLLNCHHLPITKDSLEAIHDTAKEMARTYSYGGGVGIDISIVRPERSSSGIMQQDFRLASVSFMKLYSITTGIIGQTGRRGAWMITLDVTHPDIESFVTIKKDKKSVRYANISVKVYDDFMDAVENDKIFTLHFKNEKVEFKKEIKALDLWKKRIDTAVNTGDPGIMFWDRMKSESPTEYDEKMAIKGTNPCSEQPLENYGACDLGAINLDYFVKNQCTDKAEVDWENLDKTVRYGVRFLDNVLDYSYNRHALKEQADETVYARRIGLGIMGLANMLISMNLRYDSDKAIEFVDSLMKKIKETAYDESSNLAVEKGSFPAFVAEKHLQRNFVKRLDKKLLDKISKNGLRNACILTVAPTGSISSMAGVSGGIEPICALSYTRRSESLSEGKFEVLDPFVKRYMDKFKIRDKSTLPELFVTAHKIDPFFRVKMQATIQKHIDSSISSTVNLSADTDAETVDKIYRYAWKLGCKSITVYREGSKDDILKATDEKPAKEEEKLIEEERPFLLNGTTIRMPTSQGNMYLTVNRDENAKIKEVFIDMGRSGETEKSFTEALGRLISIYLQSGGDINRVIRTLKGIKGGNSLWFNGIQVFSIPDGIAKAIELTLKNRDPTKENETLHGVLKNKDSLENDKATVCPECHQKTLIFENGCFICKNCGYTKCE